jgi:hypothetical protein
VSGKLMQVSSVYFWFSKGDEVRPNGLLGRAIMILFIPLCYFKNHDGFMVIYFGE